MEKHFLHINCNAPNGENGSFTISEVAGQLSSPVKPFCSCIFDWMEGQGFRYEAHDPEFPVGYFVKDS